MDYKTEYSLKAAVCMYRDAKVLGFDAFGISFKRIIGSRPEEVVNLWLNVH